MKKMEPNLFAQEETVTAATTPYKVARVKFIGGFNHKLYDFKIKGLILRVGDLVVVDAANGLHIAKVVELFANESTTKAIKYVVDKIDVAAHEERKADAKRIKELEKEIKDREKQLVEKFLNSMLVTDPIYCEAYMHLQLLKNKQ